MAGFFCITRISGTSHKIGRNFSQDLPHLVTRYQASRFLASFYVLFCGHIPLPVGNMPLPKNCPKNPSEVSASPQTSCSSAFRLKDMHDKILQPKKIFQRDRVSDVVLVGFLSVFGFTFIHLLTTAERKNYAVEGSRCINLSAGMPMNRTFAERPKLLKVFGGILRERGISFQKMDTHIKKNVRRLCILAASFSESCSRICRFLV